MRKILFIVLVLAIFLGMVSYIVFSGLKKTPQKITSIKDSLSKRVSLVCTYVDIDGSDVKTYIKNGAIRSDLKSKNSSNVQIIIMKDQRMYVWWTKDKKGFAFNIAKETGIKAVEGQSQINSLLSDMERYKTSCVEASEPVLDSLFVAPADVDFTDFLNQPTPTPNQTP